MASLVALLLAALPISFEGNRQIPTAELERIAAGLGAAPFDDERLHRLQLEVTARYFDRGFIDVRVDVAQPLVVRITEGEQFTLAGIHFDGAWPRPEAELRAQVQSRDGQPFSRRSVTDDLRRLRALVGRDVEVRSSVDVDRRTVSLKLLAEP